MKKYTVNFAPEAQEQLSSLYHYISVAASPTIAFNYTNSIIAYCESLQEFPQRGTPRNDVRPGLRITNFKKRTVIAFVIHDDIVSILGIFYGGQDYETNLQQDDDA